MTTNWQHEWAVISARSRAQNKPQPEMEFTEAIGKEIHDRAVAMFRARALKNDVLDELEKQFSPFAARVCGIVLKAHDQVFEEFKQEVQKANELAAAADTRRL